MSVTQLPKLRRDNPGMLSLDRQETYRERYRSRYPDWRWGGALYEATIRDYLQPLDKPPLSKTSVLDLGCGAGGVVELFSRSVYLPVGIDIDLDSLQRHRATAVQRVQGRLERIPFPKGTFDLVISSWTLEHLAAPEPVFHELARVLKSNGHFVFIAPNARSLIVRLNRLMPKMAQTLLVRFLYGRAEQDTFPALYRANTPAEIERLAQSAGLQRVMLRAVSDPSYLAFTELFFWLSIIVGRLTPPNTYVHIVGDYVKV